MTDTLTSLRCPECGHDGAVSQFREPSRAERVRRALVDTYWSHPSEWAMARAACHALGMEPDADALGRARQVITRNLEGPDFVRMASELVQAA